MRNLLCLLPLSCLLLLINPEASATPRIDVKIKYYEVEGDTLEELQQQMKTKTPIRHNGKPFDADTTWQVKWNTRWADKGISCEITSVTAAVSIIFTLPKWVNAKDASETEREKWDQFFKRLVDHENGHKDIAVGSAKEIEKVVANIKSRKDCDTLKRDSNRLGRKIMEKYSELAKQYDIETDHGRKQSASSAWSQKSNPTPAK